MTLSPAEALGTFNGFAVASLLQQQLVWIPRVILFYHTIRTGWQFRNGSGAATDSLVRLAISLAILAAFWPGAVMPGGSAALSPAAFISAAAQADGAPIQTAADTPAESQVSFSSGEIGSEIGVIPMLIVEVISEGWLNAALGTRAEALRPFSDTQPLEWLFSIDLPSGAVPAIRDFTEKCVIPAQREVLENTTTVPTWRNMQPFPGTPVGAALSGITVMPGKFFSVLGAFSLFTGGPTPCSTYASAIVSQVESGLNAVVTPGGEAMPSVWEDEVGVSVTEVAEMLIWKEIMRTGAVVPAPSLRGIYAASAVSRTVTSAAGAGLRGLMFSGPKGAAIGAGTAGAAGLTDQLTAAASAIMNLVGPALLVTEFAPELLGMAMNAMLAMMPILLTYMIVPGRQAILTPVMSYFVVIALLYSSPFWWAIIELTSTTAEQTSLSLSEAPLAFAKAKVAALLYQTIGIAIVIIGMATVIGLAAGASGISVIRSIRRPL